jgi:hypothetical protein
MRPEWSSRSRDLLFDRWFVLGVYWLPAVVIVASGFLGMDPRGRGALWSVALGTMGIGCLANAFRCRRVHCYLTGPFFLVMAMVALIYGLGVLPFGERGWNLLGAVALGGALVLYYVPERLFGRYRRRAGTTTMPRVRPQSETDQASTRKRSRRS